MMVQNYIHTIYAPNSCHIHDWRPTNLPQKMHQLIDTPMARLDPTHRKNLVNYYSNMGKR